MLLAVDIGNTNVTLGIVEDGALASVRRAATSRAGTADELEVLLRDLLALDDHALHGVSAMAVASVVPRDDRAVEASPRGWASRSSSRRPGTVPIAIRVDRPDLVGGGPDRRRARRRATPRRARPSSSTAAPPRRSTAWAPDGAFVGGAIAPGLELGLEALAARTAKLPRVELRTPGPGDRPRHRQRRSRAGTVIGYQALVAGLLARARAELAETPGRVARTVST